MSDWRNKLPIIVNKIKFQFFSRKYDDLETVSHVLQKFDKNGDGLFNKNEFGDLLSGIGVFLSAQELRIVYEQFDLNNDGKISFMEFINTLRSSMSELRLECVNQAFDALDHAQAGRLSLQELCGRYNAGAHPRVVTREKNASQVYGDFENAIRMKSRDGQTIDKTDF
jgi:Ca2+-binding EF-hand superfamily protein